MESVKGNNSAVVRLKAGAEKFNFNNLRAGRDNELANSGKTMFLDFQRMDFVINGKAIDKSLIIAFKEGARHRKSELFNSDAIYNTEIDDISHEKGTREIDTDQGKAFIASVLEDIEKELVSVGLDEVWNEHCEDPKVDGHKKTESYKEKFKEFYNDGHSYIHLLPKEKDENKDYRSFAKEVFKKIFKHVGAEVPSDAILNELITNCNQAGYGAGPFMQTQLALGQSFIVEGTKKVINIDCIDKDNVSIRSDIELPVSFLESNGMRGDKICDLSHSLKFTLKCGKGGVTYIDGEMSLTVPEQLKNYKDNGKSLFDIIKEYFETFCTKLGFKFDTEIQIEHDLGPSLKVLDETISTTGSHANEKFIELLSENLKEVLLSEDLREKLLESGVALEGEDVDDIVEVRVSTVMDLLSDYAKLEDNKESRELLINEVADNLGLSTQDKTESEVLKELSPLPSLIRDQVNHNQVQSVASIFTKLITAGERKIYEKEGAINPIDAIHQKVSKAIVEQEKKVNNKQAIKNDTWAHRIEEQNLSKSHEHLH
ncbi:hypothetical protein [Wolbachia endosymbiont of Folsomia candida]|uniref:hypothetical protein n=1 Tax=Wolbachia endosymbiont of Folsomia candida TaxID=169402 RepID=UPI000A942238|nr:hypothetical protein [Wolbachia endosymbiont of Folsomia candida]APR98827.1 hypothetical protein ASM33_06395 [Wolbachia endosymbiont of Folsomia candida]